MRIVRTNLIMKCTKEEEISCHHLHFPVVFFADVEGGGGAVTSYQLPRSGSMSYLRRELANDVVLNFF